MPPESVLSHYSRLNIFFNGIIFIAQKIRSPVNRYLLKNRLKTEISCHFRCYSV